MNDSSDHPRPTGAKRRNKHFSGRLATNAPLSSQPRLTLRELPLPVLIVPSCLLSLLKTTPQYLKAEQMGSL
jgi:hypothetical protein